MKENPIKLTQYSHGAGCGCKISPSVLDAILQAAGKSAEVYPQLLVGNDQRDDAAVMDLGDGTAIISTTDFFMPIVDDPETFGSIAATNAISDIYAMGGTPLMAIAILGWPVNLLSAETAGQVVLGAQKTCKAAGIPLAGGHSIDTPEPVFGLAVTGRVRVAHIKKNGGAKKGDVLILTKPLGTGILSTALKQNKLKAEHASMSTAVMLKLNSAGQKLGVMKGVHAMTDVTGFGLAGHLIEMCNASEASAEIEFDKLPVIDSAVWDYLHQGCIPGGTVRNFDSYGDQLHLAVADYKDLVCDPQTSGGLLLAIDPASVADVKTILRGEGLCSEPMGKIVPRGNRTVLVM